MLCPAGIERWQKRQLTHLSATDGGAQYTSNTPSNTAELQPCPKKVVATVLPFGEERVQQQKKKQYCVTTDNKEVYHLLMTIKNSVEPIFNCSKHVHHI